MPNITLIGAGSVVFTRNLCSDILFAPALRESAITLMDIDATRLAKAKTMVEELIETRYLPARVEATTDRREAVRGADYVITTFQQGGLDAYALDIDIPLRYGVGQCVGDTLGPGGVFRSLRTIPVLLDLCRDLDAVAPDALLLNYVNPMAAEMAGDLAFIDADNAVRIEPRIGDELRAGQRPAPDGPRPPPRAEEDSLDEPNRTARRHGRAFQ